MLIYQGNICAKKQERVENMKEYISRLKDNARPWEFIMWWIFRIAMIGAMIKGIVDCVKGTGDISDPLQVFGNLLAMFTWEVFMLFPKTTFTRYVPSVVQDCLIIMAFAASFCGKFLNFYYNVRFWDSGMHLLSGGICVIFGYEIVVAMQKRDKKTVSIPVALLCALGFSFFVSTLWELFEFFADQFMCSPAGGVIKGALPHLNLAAGDKIGDAQHWCYAFAEQEGGVKLATIFNPVYYERWPLMDTMGDIVLNTTGAVVGWIILKFFPFHHKGKNDVNKEIEASLLNKTKEVVTK